MFEDATFESTGRIHTRSRGWMLATLFFNTGILLTLILIPLIYPEALPHQALTFLLTAPPPPPTAPPPPARPEHAFHGVPEFRDGTLTAPPRIPRFLPQDPGPEQPADTSLLTMDQAPGLPSGTGNIFRGQHAANVVHNDSRGPVRLPSSLVAGMLIHKVTPTYPPIAVAAGMQGTVVLAATISKSGTIENLRVVSGPPMLQQAALDAVGRWAYRPYLLNGQPVEVETTVNVVFNLGR